MVGRLIPSAFAMLAGLVWLLLSGAAAADGGSPSVGLHIYREGVLPRGVPLVGATPQGGLTSGPAIACVNCHKRSGLGSGEGTIRIAPLTARFLFSGRGAYDDSTLAAAIRTGAGRGGRALNELMPRYTLDDANMRSLIQYLKSLPVVASPGVTDSTIHLATIVTADADPVARDGMLAVLKQFFEDKDVFIRGGRRPLHAQEQIGYRVTRGWQLHVWTLDGAADSWDAQLQRHLKAEPVFAVISGIGGRSWAPVHRFCETAQLPCLFPNVDLPDEAERDFYSMYFSKGVLLEAELIAARLNGADALQGVRTMQIYERGDPVAAAADKLKGLMAGNLEISNMPIAPGDAAALEAALARIRPHDRLVLWLRPAMLALLGPKPPSGATVFVSGTLAGLEQARLPADWRSVVQLTYPVDLPELRALRMNYPLRWLQIHHIPVVAERVQADTYLACGIVAQALSEMSDSFMRDYLIERIESMLSQRQLSGYYPRLGVGTGQRFASKGGYLVHFTQPSGTALAAIGDWIVP